MIAPPVPALTAAHWQALEQAYATPPRAYHGIGHVRALLQHFDAVAAGPGWTRPAEVMLAILFHDAVYQPGRSDNEARSAELARAQVPRWWPQAGYDLERVAELILLTARHGQLQPQDVDAEAALFLDCDMAILAAPPAVFDAYDAGIAAEYRGHVPGLLYRINRRRFLRGLLARPRIFLSDFFHARCDADARANLRRVTVG
jgi:predicted metal-dependent HD superfamily phosphohydrolase